MAYSDIQMEKLQSLVLMVLVFWNFGGVVQERRDDGGGFFTALFSRESGGGVSHLRSSFKWWHCVVPTVTAKYEKQ